MIDGKAGIIHVIAVELEQRASNKARPQLNLEFFYLGDWQ